jgi:Ribonuclease G/E
VRGRILVETSPGEVRAAALDAAGRLADFVLWRPGAPDGVGDLYRGRVLRTAPALAGAFVALGSGADGFLPDTEGAAGLTEGVALGVRVSRAAQGGKGPRLSARLAEAEQEATAAGPIGLMRRGPDPLLRLAALWPEAPVVADNPGLLARLAAALPGRVQSGDGFDAALAAEVAGLADPIVALPGGAVLAIHPTPALVAIDLDAAAAVGRAGGGTEPATAAHREVNRAAIPEIARQIRLRNLSGAILVDLAGLSPRQRKTLAADFAAALASDPLAPRFLGFTALGLAEIVRRRAGPPLSELLAGAHAAGLAALRAAALESRATPGTALVLRAAPAVASALTGDPAALADLARRTGRALAVRSDPSLPPEQWVLERLR